MDRNKLYSVIEVAQIIPLSKSGIYSAIKSGKFVTIKIGNRQFIPGWFLDDLIKSTTNKSL